MDLKEEEKNVAANTSRIYNWAIQRTESKNASLWFGLLFCMELVLFIPLDAIMIFFCLQNRSHIPRYIILAIAASALSGFCGYLIGHLLWDLVSPYILGTIVSPASFDHIASHYQAHETGAIFFGSLFPFPLKVLSLSAGLFHLKFAPFLMILLIARLIRFSILGALMLIFGERLKTFVERHFNRLLVLLGAKVAAGLTFFWMIAN